MADDKGGGGSEWGPLEIIIGILLLIALLDRFSGKNHIQKAIQDTNNGAVAEETLTSSCGLTLESPKPKEKINRVITLRGSVGDCDWQATSSVALYAQVVDAKGKAVSGYLPIPPKTSSDEWNLDRVSFMEAISLTGTPAAGTGYLILVPAVSSGGQQSVSARIPLTISK